MDHTGTSLWSRTLGPCEVDQHRDDRERLRGAFNRCRENAAYLASEIARSLPEFTVHDVTHADALWEYADLILGPAYELTPAEGFVLGCSFLVHDLGMAASAYALHDGGLESNATYQKIVADCRVRGDSQPESKARAFYLRNYHAQEAHEIAMREWASRDGRRFQLIEDNGLREYYGRKIGEIASSHGWSASDVPEKLGGRIGAFPSFTTEWTVDQHKLALILRVCDAAHLDQRRAPPFLAALRRPIGFSALHWEMQQRLGKPHLESDALVYSSSQGFSCDQADSWWLSWESLRMVDKELRLAHSILVDAGKPPFAARRVKGIEEPKLLAKTVATIGWTPVDASPRVSDVSALVKKLGGEQLYGQSVDVPVRELIQNSRDAVKARQALAPLVPAGRVLVTLGSDAEGRYLEVDDGGIGMNESVLSGDLLDFGSSFWSTDRAQQALPGIVGNGFVPVGRFGIGFFSVFMLGNHVKVTTRHCMEAPADTRVLEFLDGVNFRPRLRNSQPEEFRHEPGTAVRIWLTSMAHELLRVGSVDSFQEYVAWLCPAVDVDVDVRYGGVGPKSAVRANDWITISGADLLRRLWARWNTRASYGAHVHASIEKLYGVCGARVRPLTDDSGRPVGRVAVMSGVIPIELWSAVGVVTLGGFRSTAMSNVTGILIGEHSGVSRDSAIPQVDFQRLAAWATDQAMLLDRSRREDEDVTNLESAVETVIRCGGGLGGLPVGYSRNGEVSIEGLRKMAVAQQVLYIAREEMGIDSSRASDLQPSVLVISSRGNAILQNSQGSVQWPPFRSRQHVIVSECFSAWGIQEAKDSPPLSQGRSRESRMNVYAAGPPVMANITILNRQPQSN
ncbi:MAG TPA: ATP-binding protein [Paludibaculum sp.]|jgi:hypothetical protein